MATKKSKAVERLTDELEFERLNKQVAFEYLVKRLKEESDEEVKKQIQVQVDKAQKMLEDVRRLSDFFNDEFNS